MKSRKAKNTVGRRRLLHGRGRRPPRGERGAILTVAGIVTALVLILGAAAVVQLTSGNLRGVFASSDSRQARGAAEEGIELMISTWNQRQNRALLVSGEDPATWAVGDPSLATPCPTTETGAQPEQLAINLADGAWRNVVTGATAGANTDGRQFRLIRITYTASDGNQPDPRALRRTATPGGGSSGDAIPPDGWRSRINLTNPDPNPNTGYLILEVEGRLVSDNRVVANSRLTQEFEVLPKCCDCSLGSGGAASLGADQRCDPDEPVQVPPPPGVCPLGKAEDLIDPAAGWVAPADWVARGPTSSRLW